MTSELGWSVLLSNTGFCQVKICDWLVTTGSYDETWGITRTSVMSLWLVKMSKTRRIK